MPFPSGFEHIVRENELLAPYTWLRIGGLARFFCEPTSLDQLVNVIRACDEQSIQARILGGGSNLLVREAGVDGLVISLSAPVFSQMDVRDNTIVCGGGAKLSHLISHCVGAGLGGLEHLVGIPGTVGGALANNASTLNGDIGSHVRSVKLLTRKGELVVRTGKQLQFSHHQSSLDELVILEAEFLLEHNDVRNLTKRMQTIWIVKRAQQPTLELPSAIPFVQPDTITVSDLIDQAGMRHASEGSVQICSSFPEFLTVGNSATSEQVIALIDRVRESVARNSGVQLQLHLKIW